MKKKMVILTLLLSMITIFILMKGNNKEKENDINDIYSNVYYGQKYSYIEGEDGWYYFFCINILDDAGTTANFYDGINLKYKSMDEYNVLVYDEVTGELKKKIATTPSFRSSEKIKNGVQERDEILKVDSYFDEKQFNRVITEEDLKDLKLENFNKEQIIELYNMAIEAKLKTERKAFYIPSFELKQKSLSDGSVINMGLYTETTGMIAMRIDIIYDDVYLSDLVQSNKASKEQIELYDNLRLISDKFIETQDVRVKKYFQFDGEIYDRVFEIIETFDDERS